ncbi:MAG TPA: hypothetical protein VII74_03970, partial [Chthoniobacterales bacterium]
LLMEHVFTTADVHDAKLLTPMLAMGLDMNFERSHDLSAVIHAERLPDGRIQITAVPLLYGSYAVTRGTGTFSLEPPNELNLEAGWPIFKGDSRRRAEVRYDSYRQKLAPTTSSLPIVGLPPAKTAPQRVDALVRVEAAVPLPAEPSAPQIPFRHGAHHKEVAEAEKNNQPASPSPSPPSLVVRRALPIGANDVEVAAAGASSTPRVMRALPLDAASPATAIASTTGATWKTFPAGQVPAGRMLDPAGLREVANKGTQGQRVYLRGQFVVNFADGNRAVLRPTVDGASAAFSHGARIIVDYPAGAPLPEPGSVLERDASRPFEVTEVRQQSDGQLNVFVREIIRPAASAPHPNE